MKSVKKPVFNSLDELIKWYNFNYYIINSFKYDSNEFRYFERAYDLVYLELFKYEPNNIKIYWKRMHDSKNGNLMLKQFHPFYKYVDKILKDLNPFISSLFQKEINLNRRFLNENTAEITQQS